MGIRLDESDWPIVVGHWEGTLTQADLTQALTNMDRWLARRQRFGLLIDARHAGALPPEQRTRLVEHMKANAELTARYLVQAGVLDSLLQRTLFYAVNLLFPNPFPAKVFSTPEPARAWLLAMLERSSDSDESPPGR